MFPGVGRMVEVKGGGAAAKVAPGAGAPSASKECAGCGKLISDR